MPAELAVGYITLIPSARGIAAGLENELTGPLVIAGKQAGAKSSESFKSQFKSGITKLAVGGAVIAGIVAVGKQFEDAFNTIERGTGATGDTLKGLDESFKNVLKSGSGSFDQVSAAITTLNQRTGLTGKALEDFARKEVSLARITKTDVNANLQATTGLFNLYGIAAAQQSKKLDVLFKASQLAGVSVTQLASEMQAAAPTAKLLGLSIDQTASLVANLDKAGLPASKVMLGLASTFAKAAKAGKEPLTVIHDLVAEVKKAPTPAAAATVAIQKFGIGARQAGVLVAGLRSGAIDLEKSLDGGKGILATAAATATLSGKFAHLKNVALVALEPLATQVLNAVLKGVEAITPAIEFLTDHMDVLGPIILSVAGAFAAFKITIGIQDIITASVSAFESLTKVMFGNTAAAAAQATAMTGVTAATAEAAVASEGLALTPVGAALLATGAAIALLTGKLALFSHSQKDAGQATNDFVSSLLDEGKALDDIGGQVVVKAIRKNADLNDSLKATGISAKEVADAISGNGKAYDDIQKKLEAYQATQLKSLAANNDTTKGFQVQTSAGRANGAEVAKLGHTVDTLTGFIDKNRKSLADQNRDFKNAAGASKELSVAEAGTVHWAEIAAVAQDQLRIAATNLTTAIINNADRLRGLQEGLIGVFQSAINLKAGLRDVAEKQAEYNKFVVAGTQNSKDGQKALEDLQLAQLGQASSTASSIDSAAKLADSTSHLSDELKKQADAQAGLSKAQSEFNSGKGSPGAVAAAQETLNKATQDVTLAQKKYRDQILAVASQVSGPLHDALLVYAGQIANLPAKKPTEITVPGLDKTAVRLHNYRDEMGRLPAVRHTKIALDADKAINDLFTLKQRILQLPSNIPFSAVVRAEGGRIPGGAHGLVATKPMVAMIGENAATTPEIVSPVSLMAKTFKAELARTGSGGTIDARVIINGPVTGVDDLDAWADRRDQKLKMALAVGHR